MLTYKSSFQNVATDKYEVTMATMHIRCYLVLPFMVMMLLMLRAFADISMGHSMETQKRRQRPTTEVQIFLNWLVNHVIILSSGQTPQESGHEVGEE